MMDDARITAARILIVDDEQSNVRLLERLLLTGGYTDVRGTTDSRAALALFNELQPDLVLVDLHMPHMDGFALMAALGERLAPNEYLPFLVLTADTTRETKERALSSGAKDFLTKPLERMEVLLRTRNLLETRFLHVALKNENRELEAKLVHQAFHDSLTGLANRALFRDRVDHALARSSRGERVAVLFLDLDNFKSVNDTLGHVEGDRLLHVVATRLLKASRGLRYRRADRRRRVRHPARRRAPTRRRLGGGHTHHGVDAAAGRVGGARGDDRHEHRDRVCPRGRARG